MATKVTDLVGFRFDSLKKAWMAAFFLGSLGGAPLADASSKLPEADGHYELLSLEEIHKRESAALAEGDLVGLSTYMTADHAIAETIAGKRSSPSELPSDFSAKLFTESSGELFKVVDPAKDFDWTEFRPAQKTAKIKAELVEPGTKVDTIMANGLVETSNAAGPEGGYRVTALTGEQYLVSKPKFEKLYVPTETKGVYAPKPDTRKVLPIASSVAFTAPWGEEMRIRGGGVLVNSGENKIYGIQPDEFKATYSFL